MVKQCMSNGSNFVISNKSDRVDDFDFGIERVGTSVQIIDFNNLVKNTNKILEKICNKLKLDMDLLPQQEFKKISNKTRAPSS